MQDAPQERWYALYVRPHHEKSVTSQLAAKRQNVFLPLYTDRRRWADRWKNVNLPLFPSYVFCHFDARDRARVLTTPGIIDLVRHDGSPAPLEDSEIEAIRKVVQSNVKAEPYQDSVDGRDVLIVEGPLSGISGRLIETRKGPRLVVSVDLLCRSVLVEIDRNWAAPTFPGSGTWHEAHAHALVHQNVI